MTATAIDNAGCIQDLIQRQARKTPDATALTCDGRTVSYKELDRRSNQLANSLRRRGLGPEKFVGVCLQRSIDSAIALLGILKSGAAYVYLDPEYPARRLDDIVRDCRPHLVIASDAQEHQRFDEPPCMGLPSTGLADEDTSDPSSGVNRDNAAYLLYTSGSTGSPKGVIGIHGSLTARLESGDLPDIQPDDVCGLNSSLGFGITASRMFLPLAIGASVAILPDKDVKDIGRFTRALEANQVTSAFIPAAVLRTILSLPEESRARVSRLRAVTVTGAALTPDLARLFLRAFPKTQLVNVYGSAEIGTTATIEVVDRVTESRVVSIGSAVAGTRIYLLDEDLTQVPVGDSGEICIGAAHLARGYLNLPELTAEKFIPDPFVPGSRIYRTGDTGRILPNGQIQFLGRRDHQVKIRGFRIELGEIEAVLEEHADVQEAALVARDYGNEKRLTAYFIAETDALSTTKLREFLAERLPDQMIPATFVRLSQMPRTDSGKIDRNSLPAFDPSRPEIDSPYEAPRNPLETAIAEVWSDVLKIDDIGIHDNFLELGGDSLSATQAMLRIQDRFGIELTLESFFDTTIAELVQQQGFSGVFAHRKL